MCKNITIDMACVCLVLLKSYGVKEWPIDGGLELGEQLIQLIIEIIGISHRLCHVVDEKRTDRCLFVIILDVNVDYVHT